LKGYCAFHIQNWPSRVQHYLGVKAHAAVCNGSQEQTSNIKECSKNRNIEEFGRKAAQGECNNLQQSEISILSKKLEKPKLELNHFKASIYV